MDPSNVVDAITNIAPTITPLNPITNPSGVFVVGTGTIISLLSAAVIYLRQISQNLKLIADNTNKDKDK